MAAFASLASLRAYLPQIAIDGQQLVTISGAAGGTFTLSYEGVASSALAWNASATTVQTALRAIAAIGSSGVTVRGRPGGPYTATFQGTLAQDAGPLTGDASLLTPTSTIMIAPASDSVLQSCLDRASDIVRSAMRAALADPTFDYAAWAAASTKIVRAYDGCFLRVPPYQAGSITLIEYQSGSTPSSYTALTAAQWETSSNGDVYRASGWGNSGWGDLARYRVTAVYGYGPTPPDALVELTLELAVNIWRSRDTGGFSEQIGVEGPGAIRIVAGLNKLQQRVIDDLVQQLLVIGV